MSLAHHVGACISLMDILVKCAKQMYSYRIITLLGAVIIARIHLVHLMNADWAPDGQQPSNPANRLSCEYASRLLPSTSIVITQPGSWYSVYRLTEGGRPSWLRHCSKGVQPVPKAVYCSSCHGKHICPQLDLNLGPVTLLSRMLPHDNRDLNEVNNENIALSSRSHVVSGWLRFNGTLNTN